MLSVSNMDQCTLNLIVVRGILDVYAHYCRTVITNKYVDYWIHGNISLKKSVYRLLWMETGPFSDLIADDKFSYKSKVRYKKHHTKNISMFV